MSKIVSVVSWKVTSDKVLESQESFAKRIFIF